MSLVYFMRRSDGVGAVKIVRTHFDLTPQRLHMWRRRGVPGEYRAALVKLAAVHGKRAPEGFLDPRPPRTSAPEQVAA